MAAPGTQAQEDRLKDLLGIPRDNLSTSFGDGGRGGGAGLTQGVLAVPSKRVASDMVFPYGSEQHTPEPQVLDVRLNSENTTKPQGENSSLQASDVMQDAAEEATIVDKTAEKRKAKKKARLDKSLARNTREVLQTISLETLAPVKERVSWDQDPELICSYNWRESQDGTNVIFVPGGPPKWTPPVLPYTLPPDSGEHCTDLNYGRYPSRPYAPMFHAIELMKPNFIFDEVDVVAERNNLRTLLEFCQGKKFAGYRLDMHLVDRTMFLVKRQDKYWNHAAAGQRSYGYSFEEHFTRAGDGLGDATNHYRVVQYPLGSLKVAVRFEADAYYEEPHETDVHGPQILYGQSKQRAHYNQKAPIRAVHAGENTPCSSIAELKTQSYKLEHGLNYSTYVDQVWFGRTTHLLTGVYDKQNGSVLRVSYKNTREMAANWEDNVQDGLQKLVALLDGLRSFLTKLAGPVRAAVLVREERDGPLQIRQMDFKQHIVEHAFYQRHWTPRTRLHPARGSFNNANSFGRAPNDRGRGSRGFGHGYPHLGHQRGARYAPGPPPLPIGRTLNHDPTRRGSYFVEEANGRSQWEQPPATIPPQHSQSPRRGRSNNLEAVRDSGHNFGSSRGRDSRRGSDHGLEGERDRVGRTFGDTSYPGRQSYNGRGRGSGRTQA